MRATVVRATQARDFWSQIEGVRFLQASPGTEDAPYPTLTGGKPGMMLLALGEELGLGKPSLDDL